MKTRSTQHKDRILVVDNHSGIHDAFRNALVDDLNADGLFELVCTSQTQEGLDRLQQALHTAHPFTVAFIGVSQASGWREVEIAPQIWALDPRVQIVFCADRWEVSTESLFATNGAKNSGWLVLKTPLAAVVVKQVTHALTEKWHLQQRCPVHQNASSEAEAAGTEIPSGAPQINEQDLLNTLMENSPDSIFFKDLESRLVKVSRSEVHNLRRLSISRYRAAHPDLGEDELPPHLASVEAFEKYVIGKTDADIYGEDRADEFCRDEKEIIRTGKPIVEKSERTVHPDGRVVWYLTTKGPWRDRNGQLIGTFGTSKNMSELKEAERRIEEVQAQLLTTARLAGMAEIATNVLHNVGNVLNSVNVSADLIAAQLRTSKYKGLARAVDLMEAHAEDLGEFLTQDAKGKLLPTYLRGLARALEVEHQAMTTELGALCSSVDHIKQVIATQQSYAGTPRVVESARVNELLDDALRMHADALTRHKVEVERPHVALPSLLLDRHRVLQVLVNLISNAKQALDTVSDRRPLIKLNAALLEGVGGAVLRITVTDNGEGIAPENLTRVFSHGFTTRKNVHGFGLHSCVLAAQEMGGSLHVHSDGPGQGASFILEVPTAPAQVH
ncbi:MAG TPA: ATP-binding protein [Hydrogenophaga sp.]|nr:ATP-binding protein [Hydrogenophaga sp.]